MKALSFSLTPSTLSPKPHRPTLPNPSRRTQSPPLKKIKTHLRVSSPTSPPAVTDEPEREFRGEVEEKFDWYSCWYPLAPVCDLDKRVPHARTVMGLDVVVWWDRNDGAWKVFDDRCPHRLAPLSEGRIDRWGRLQCVYHGWCFDGAGGCKYIPQAPPDGPQFHTFNKACAAAYPSVEQNKIVWFWPSTEPQYNDILTKKKPPYIPELDDPTYTDLMGTRDIPYGYEVLIENLMDPSHVHYAHYGIMRIPKSVKAKDDREGGRPLEINIQTLDKSGFLAKQESGYSKFIAPCIYYAFPSWGEGQDPNSSGSTMEDSILHVDLKQRRFLLIFICIPVSPGKSRLIWVFPRNFSVWLDRIVPRWMFHLGQNLILDSDLYLLHLEERKIQDAGASNWLKACFVPTKADALVVAFRKWLRNYADNQIHWGTKDGGVLPPTPPKEQLMDRYWSHVVHCRSCNAALKGLRVLEVALQVLSIASIGFIAVARQNMMSSVARTAVVSAAVLCFIASKWLSHFIYKNFYFHDYNHALI